MRDTFLVLGIVCAILGFFVHDLWYVAIPAFMISSMLTPSERRADGQKKLPGPFGWLLDEMVLSIKMTKCPHCGHKVLKKDTICLYCHKDIHMEPEEHQEEEQVEEDEQAENQTDSHENEK